jgi:23S rRNA (uracil1939-C5)-methyltransferase
VTETVELEIESIGAGGDGVARLDRLVVFVPRSAPGDRALVRVERRGRLGRGEIERLLQPSGDRVDPPCPHYVHDRCGGCQLQHLRYPAQIGVKSGIVRDALTRIARSPVDQPPVRESPRQWRYRTKLTLALRRHGREWIGGLHPYDDPVAVFQLADCPITHEGVIAAWREVLAASDALPDSSSLRGAIAAGDTEDEWSLHIEGGAQWERSAEFFDRVPGVAALWWSPGGQRRRLLYARGVTPPDPSFRQVNPGLATLLQGAVIDAVTRYAPATVVDAYAGSGGVAAALASRGAAVTAIEHDSEAAARGAALLGAPSRMVTGAVERALPSLLPVDVVILNPPRAGVHETVTSVLDRGPRPRAIVYVSCDAATLARDVGRLPSYEIRHLECFDMFPQTAHVETLCELVPRAA